MFMFLLTINVVVPDIVHNLAACAPVESVGPIISMDIPLLNRLTHTTEKVPTRDRQPSVSLKISSMLLIFLLSR